MTIKEKLEEIANSVTAKNWYVFVHDALDDGDYASVDELRDGTCSLSAFVLNSELVSCTFGFRNNENCIFLGYQKKE